MKSDTNTKLCYHAADYIIMLFKKEPNKASIKELVSTTIERYKADGFKFNAQEVKLIKSDVKSFVKDFLEEIS